MSEKDYVVVQVGGHHFGFDAAVVQDVFYPRQITPVPLAAPEVTGLLNLRGRIVTAVCTRTRLGLPPLAAGAPEPKAVGVELHGDNYGLIVDEVDTVMKLDPDALIPPPDNLPTRWSEIIVGVFRLSDRLLVVLDAPRLLAGINALGAAA